MPLWEKLFKDGTKQTLKPVKKHNTLKRKTLSEYSKKTLSEYSKKTLGSGDLKRVVALPPEEKLEEWFASNTVDFFNELSLLYGICADDASRYKELGTGFPPGFEYRWQGADGKKLLRVSGPEYVDYVMTWVEDQIDNSAIFPELESQPFPADFLDYIKDIFKRMFRVFAIIYHAHFDTMEKCEAQAHLNTCFKHFMFFVFQFDLVDDKELQALKGPVDRLRKEYDTSSE